MSIDDDDDDGNDSADSKVRRVGAIYRRFESARANAVELSSATVRSN